MGKLPHILTCYLAVMLLSASSGISCTCAPKLSVARALSLSDAVFVGRVIARHDARVEILSGNTSGFSFVFEVEKLYKGTVSGEIAVVTGNGRGDCGYPFRLGEKYLVYAYCEKELRTHICTRTTDISAASADLAELGVPMTIFVRVTSPAWRTALAIVVVAFVAGFVIGKNWLPRPGSRLGASC
jgi:hypothetical protein